MANKLADFIDADAIMQIINGNYQALKEAVAQSNVAIREAGDSDKSHAPVSAEPPPSSNHLR